jgi:hypothetical protein
VGALDSNQGVCHPPDTQGVSLPTDQVGTSSPHTQGGVSVSLALCAVVNVQWLRSYSPSRAFLPAVLVEAYQVSLGCASCPFGRFCVSFWSHSTRFPWAVQLALCFTLRSEPVSCRVLRSHPLWLVLTRSRCVAETDCISSVFAVQVVRSGPFPW